MTNRFMVEFIDAYECSGDSLAESVSNTLNAKGRTVKAWQAIPVAASYDVSDDYRQSIITDRGVLLIVDFGGR